MGYTMRKSFAAFAFAAVALAQPASAVTFSQLTTIYIISGAKDSGGGANVGHATTVQCSNVSGVAANIRFLLLGPTGSVFAFLTRASVPHGATVTVSTHATLAYTTNESQLLGAGGAILDAGALNIESTQSGVFCTASIIDASVADPEGFSLHLIRINPHPGAVE
jgi:hypothetical protein